ncbi:hypothetical protein PHSC3_000522 [Chlamydiales bacterium STE3]|nr:hypothetical protein PHSC3_000522 [Chlamydiales bacterium STE3]
MLLTPSPFFSSNEITPYPEFKEQLNAHSLIPGQFSQPTVLKRIARLVFNSLQNAMGITEDGQQVDIKVEGLAFHNLLNFSKIKAYQHHFYFILTQDSEQYRLLAKVKGLGGGNTSTKALAKAQENTYQTETLIKNLNKNLSISCGEIKGSIHDITECIRKGANVNYHLDPSYIDAPHPYRVALQVGDKKNLDALIQANCSVQFCPDLAYLMLLRIKLSPDAFALHYLKSFRSLGADMTYRTPLENPYPQWDIPYFQEATLADVAFLLELPEIFEWLLSIGIEPIMQKEELTQLSNNVHRQRMRKVYLHQKNERHLEDLIQKGAWNELLPLIRQISKVKQKFLTLCVNLHGSKKPEDLPIDFYKILNLMISKGADLHSKIDQQCLIDYAINHQWKPSFILHLLKKGATPQSDFLHSLLFLSLVTRDEDYSLKLTKKVLSSGRLPVNSKDRYGNSLIFYAALERSWKLTELLLKYSASINGIPYFIFKDSPSLLRENILNLLDNEPGQDSPMKSLANKIINRLSKDLILEMEYAEQLYELQTLICKALEKSDYAFSLLTADENEIKSMEGALDQIFLTNESLLELQIGEKKYELLKDTIDSLKRNDSHRNLISLEELATFLAKKIDPQLATSNRTTFTLAKVSRVLSDEITRLDKKFMDDNWKDLRTLDA